MVWIMFSICKMDGGNQFSLVVDYGGKFITISKLPSDHQNTLTSEKKYLPNRFQVQHGFLVNFLGSLCLPPTKVVSQSPLPSLSGTTGKKWTVFSVTSKPSIPRKATWSAHSASSKRKPGTSLSARLSSHKTSHCPLCFVFRSTWSPKPAQPLRRTWLLSLTHTAPQRQSNNTKHQTATDSFVFHANPTSGSCHIFFKSHA